MNPIGAFNPTQLAAQIQEQLQSPGSLGAPSKTGPLKSIEAPFAAPSLSGPSSSSGASFSNLLENAVSGIDGKMKAAESEKVKVMTGESSNLHQSMIAMQEASVAFSLMVEVRNKLVESYQELMRMQI